MKHFKLVLFICLIACHSNPNQEEKTNTSSQEINEKTYINLGDEEQYVETFSKSADNPVLLFLHGGPGWTETPNFRYFNSEIAEKFTVVLWDQRGAGKSFLKNPEAKNISLEQLLKDTHQLTQILKEKYKKDKIYLVGYSWGSILGAYMAQKYPEDYIAYIGVCQFINRKQGTDISLNWLREQAQEKNDQAALQTLDSLQNPDLFKDKTTWKLRQYGLLTQYKGALYNEKALPPLEEIMAKSPDYQDHNWMDAFQYSSKFLQDALMHSDLYNIKRIEIPVYLILGRHDWNVPAVLARDWLNDIEAPKKELFWLENSAHALMMEEAKLFNAILTEQILTNI